MKNSLIVLSILFVSAQIIAQKSVSDLTTSYEESNECTFESIYFSTSASDEEGGDVVPYSYRDSRADTKSGRYQMVTKALLNIFKYGKYIERCGNDVGLNYFDWVGPYQQGFIQEMKGNFDYWNKDGGRGNAYITIRVDYIQVQRENLVAGKIKTRTTKTEYPESGKIHDCGYGSMGFFGGDVMSDIVDPGDENAVYIPNSEEHKYDINCDAESDVHKGQSHMDFYSKITIYPLLFESVGFYMEGEKRWAEDMMEAIEYVLLHEFGHLERHMYENLKYSGYPYLDSGEPGADNFAFSVWRCKRN